MEVNEVLADLTHGELVHIANEIRTFTNQGFLPDGLIKDKYLPKMKTQKDQDHKGDLIFDQSAASSYMENMQTLVKTLSQIILNDYINMKQEHLKNLDESNS